MKKILLAILACFIGIVGIKADNNELEKLQDDYNKTKGVYCDIAILNCYDINLLNKTYTSSERAAEQCLNQFSRGKCNGHISLNKGRINRYYNLGQTGGSLGYSLFRDWGFENNNDYATLMNILNQTNYGINWNSKLKAAQATMETAAKALDTNTNGKNYTSDAKDMVSAINVTYASMCEYLKNHQGIKDFVKMIIDIVCYAALAAGIILGIMDFVKAIASHEDAALTKAFQSFMKRVIAIALIFLSNVFVTLILGVVQRNDYLNMARENATCFTDEVIKTD